MTLADAIKSADTTAPLVGNVLALRILAAEVRRLQPLEAREAKLRESLEATKSILREIASHDDRWSMLIYGATLPPINAALEL